jgi:ParB-like chromosome segregation protein Spo0J
LSHQQPPTEKENAMPAVNTTAARLIDHAVLSALPVHPYAEQTPAMSATSLDALASSLASEGQLTPVTLYQGQILDGRHRRIAAERAGVGLWVVDFTGSDRAARLAAIQQNVSTRDLTESQRALAAAKIVTTSNGGVQNADAVSQAEAAALFNVSLRYVVMASRLLRTAPADMLAEIWAGSLSLTAANARLNPRPPRAARANVAVVETDDEVGSLSNVAPMDVAAFVEAIRNGTVDAAAFLAAVRGPDAGALVLKLDDLARAAYDLAAEEGIIAA